MGVMECDRAGCTNIMAEHIIDNEYLCETCYNEFEEWIEEECEGYVITEYEFLQKFHVFMKTEVGSRSSDTKSHSEWLTRFHSNTFE